MKSKFPSFFFSQHSPNYLACWFSDKRVYSLFPRSSEGITSFLRFGEGCRQNEHSLNLSTLQSF